MSNKIDLNKLCYFLITGASRGIGQTLAIECSKKFKNNSVIVLLARSLSGLEVTKRKCLDNNPNLHIIIISIDLLTATKDDFNNIIINSLNNINVNDIELAFIIHNVGTIGDTTKHAKQLDNKDEWLDYYTINVITVAILNAQFLKFFNNVKNKLVINITSKCGQVPFKSFTLYCSGKAAREMYFKVLAEEEKNNLIVLNYSPGPVDTDMTIITQNNSCDTDIRNYFKNLRDNKTILTTIETTMKFLNILSNGNFNSGDTVDYYD